MITQTREELLKEITQTRANIISFGVDCIMKEVYFLDFLLELESIACSRPYQSYRTVYCYYHDWLETDTDFSKSYWIQAVMNCDYDNYKLGVDKNVD